MKTRNASSIRLTLMAGALALVVSGCGSMDRSADRAVEPAGYAGQSGNPGIPPSIDPFSSRYLPFPVSADESAGVSGHSTFCEQHYSQPGCQTGDQAQDSRGMNGSRRY